MKNVDPGKERKSTCRSGVTEAALPLYNSIPLCSAWEAGSGEGQRLLLELNRCYKRNTYAVNISARPCILLELSVKISWESSSSEPLGIQS